MNRILKRKVIDRAKGLAACYGSREELLSGELDALLLAEQVLELLTPHRVYSPDFPRKVGR